MYFPESLELTSLWGLARQRASWKLPLRELKLKDA